MSKLKKNKESSPNVDIENISFGELRVLLSKNILTKNQLLEIGKRRFGISKGANQKFKKERIQILIENAMRNMETLDIIKQKASE